MVENQPRFTCVPKCQSNLLVHQSIYHPNFILHPSQIRSRFVFFSRFSIFAMIYLGVFQKNYEIVNCGPTAHTRVNHPTVQPNKTKARTRESSSRGAAVTRRRLRTLKIPCEFPRMPSSWSGHNPLVPWDQPQKGRGLGAPFSLTQRRHRGSTSSPVEFREQRDVAGRATPPPSASTIPPPFHAGPKGRG